MSNSPKINNISWGKVQVEDNTYKDVKLYPGGCREWDWTETGTHHSPGIQPADVEELLEHGAEVMIFSRGFNERLKTADKTKQWLTEKGLNYHILQTEKAVQKYNQLCDTAAVGALIHSTC